MILLSVLAWPMYTLCIVIYVWVQWLGDATLMHRPYPQGHYDISLVLTLLFCLSPAKKGGGDTKLHLATSWCESPLLLAPSIFWVLWRVIFLKPAGWKAPAWAQPSVKIVILPHMNTAHNWGSESHAQRQSKVGKTGSHKWILSTSGFVIPWPRSKTLVRLWLH